jgi:molybdopterin-containing oxidoreductase family iron-sulfur binding subunit
MSDEDDQPRRWRSLKELLEGAGALEADAATAAAAGWSRRGFLQLLGASAALAGIEGCDRTPPAKIVPYTIAPPGVEPGVPSWYATSMLLDGFAVGLLARTNEGRPTKLEGNPLHPSSLGAAGRFEQASLLQLYDPDRAQRVRYNGELASWDGLLPRLRQARTDGGAGLRILVEPTSSPTVARLLGLVRARHPRTKVTCWAPLSPVEHARAGAALALGRPLEPRYRLEGAGAIVALDADLLDGMPGSLAHQRQWAARRHAGADMSRLYAVECAMSVTGSVADQRLRRRSAEIAGIARALAARLPGVPAALGAGAHADDVRFVDALARDLAARPPGTTLIAVGPRQPPAVHALGLALNAALGNLGTTVTLQAPVLIDGDQDLRALIGEMRNHAVDTLVILEGNPVYGAPADLDFAGALAHVESSIHLAAYDNETARRCKWTGPAAHYLESWGDGRAHDGTLSFTQPTIVPLHGGRTPIEILATLAGDPRADGRRLVRQTHAGLDWEAALQRGVVEGTAARSVTPQRPDAAAIARALAAIAPVPAGAVEVNFQPSPTLHDGRFSNNAWLLEQPDPITKLTWSNAVLMSPATASRLGLSDDQQVEVDLGARSLRGPVFVAAGHADEAVTVWLGWGRQGGESLAAGRGFAAGTLRTMSALDYGAGALHPVNGRVTEPPIPTQGHFHLHGRPIALSTTRADPTVPDELREPLATLYQIRTPRTGVQWAMSIDLSICTGCSACMVACQAENNVPVVGPANVRRHREMHWLRIDSYYSGSAHDPRVIHQPMMCQHCEAAPCEYVCPVNATVHSPDGLNEMVYNRCVGTRFCSNNCPYKVRRFNWFNWYRDFEANQGLVELGRNPEVTVRARGVMEKCTYCVQRIRTAEIRASIERRPLAMGEVVTACQQACPTGAIAFDSLSQPDSEMMRRRDEPRAYAVLHDQGTRPRTLYLARVDNPNPELG